MKTKTKMEFNTILLRSLLDMTSIPTEQDHKQFETKQGVKQGIPFTYLGRFLPPANEGMGS